MSTSKQPPQASHEETEHTMSEIFHNDIRSKMWGLFSMYPELTLRDLSEYLGKSKSTIHPHLKLLEDMDLIEEVREEKVRGQYKAKIYSLKKGYQEKFGNWGLQKNCQKTQIDLDMAQRIAKNVANWIQIQIDNLDMQKQFFRKLQAMLNGSNEDEKTEALGVIQRIYGLKPSDGDTQIFTKKGLKAFGYFDEESFQYLYSKFMDFFKDISKFSDKREEDDPTIEKPYYMLMNVIPMKEVYDFLNKRK